MIELLKLCGFEEQEIESELPRVEKAFNKLGITDEDIERGKQRLARYYDIELKGVRRAFRLIVRDLVDVMLSKEEGKKKIIYGFMSPGIDLLGSAVASKTREALVIHQCWAFHVVIGCIFGKMAPILEAAEKKWLKAGMVAHCANVKTIVGPIALGLFPKPDLLVTSGFLCETAPKTLDLLHELYDIPVWFIETCRDREFSEYDEATLRTAGLAAKNLKRLAGRIQEIVGLEITDDMLREVQDAKGRLDNAFRRIRDLVESSDPLPLSPAHENIWMCLNALTLSTNGIEEAVEAINMLYEELQERVARGLGVVEKGAPRVLAILPAGQTDPRLEHLACEVGIAIVGIDMTLGVPFKETSEDPYVKFGLSTQQHSLGMEIRGRIPLIIEGCKKLNIAGVLDRFHVGCRSVAADALIIEEAVRKELGIPVLLLEWENFDPRVYNHEQYKNKLEVFKAMMVKR
jgi:benzoyl-CoA reductase/2-hydroxyglutaryl-CoA dehydratase subunit BcrC/BadD/HgdB